MKYIHGDLVKMAKKGEFDVVVHGCNCFCNMGAGIAKTIRIHFPLAYAVDKNTEHGDKTKLGTISVANDIRCIVVNAYTQYGFGGNKANVDYNAIKNCFIEIKKKFSGKKIGIPKIGAGLAGGDWDKIESIIDEIMKDEDVTCVLFG